VTVRGLTVGCEIEDEREGSFHEMSGRDLDARFPVVNPETTGERLIGHCTSLFTGRV